MVIFDCVYCQEMPSDSWTDTDKASQKDPETWYDNQSGDAQPQTDHRDPPIWHQNPPDGGQPYANQGNADNKYSKFLEGSTSKAFQKDPSTEYYGMSHREQIKTNQKNFDRQYYTSQDDTEIQHNLGNLNNLHQRVPNVELEASRKNAENEYPNFRDGAESKANRKYSDDSYHSMTNGRQLEVNQNKPDGRYYDRSQNAGFRLNQKSPNVQYHNAPDGAQFKTNPNPPWPVHNSVRQNNLEARYYDQQNEAQPALDNTGQYQADQASNAGTLRNPPFESSGRSHPYEQRNRPGDFMPHSEQHPAPAVEDKPAANHLEGRATANKGMLEPKSPLGYANENQQEPPAEYVGRVAEDNESLFTRPPGLPHMKEKAKDKSTLIHLDGEVKEDKRLLNASPDIVFSSGKSFKSETGSVQYKPPATKDILEVENVDGNRSLSMSLQKGLSSATPTRQTATTTVATTVWTTTTPRSTTTPPEQEVRCPTSSHWYPILIADPDDCTSYYACYYGIPLYIKCPFGNNFSQMFGGCTVETLAPCTDRRHRGP